MADTGFVTCGTGANVDHDTSKAWLNPTNITADDASNANADNLDAFDPSDWLFGSNHGFAIPVGSTIDGIEVRHETSAGSGDVVVDSEAKIFIAGAEAGTNQVGNNEFTTTPTLYTYGSPTELWGLTPTVAQVNATDFGWGLIVIEDDGGANADAFTDFTQMKIYFTPPVAGDNLLSMIP